jgi:lysozyme
MPDRALLIGIDRYPGQPLQGCGNDAAAMAAFITEQGLYSADQWRLCLDGRATGAAIRERLQWLFADTAAGDKRLFFFSGHGVRLPRRDNGVVTAVEDTLCGVDFDPDQAGSGIGAGELEALIEGLKDGASLTLIVDAGFADTHAVAAQAGTRGFRLPLDVGWARALAADSANSEKVEIAQLLNATTRLVTYLGASGSGQPAGEAITGRGSIHGELTAALLACLSPPNSLTAATGDVVEAVRRQLRAQASAQQPVLAGDGAAKDRALLGRPAARPAAAAAPPSPPPASGGGIRKYNAATLRLVKQFEGILDGDASTPNLDPYLDPVQIWTIGWGHAIADNGRWLRGQADAARARALYPGGISMADAENLLHSDLLAVCSQVQSLLRVIVSDNQFGALVSFTFNLGADKLEDSTLLGLLNRGDSAAAANEFGRWVYAGGQRMLGLVRRRAAEQALFLSP